MKWYALTHLGGEKGLANELSSLGFKSVIKVGGCSFEATEKEAGEVLFRIQCATRLMLALDEAPFDELNLSSAHDIIPDDKTFKVTCELAKEDELTAMEFASKLGEKVERKVNLNKPDFTVHCLIADTCLCGIDVCGDLSKRYYRIFTNAKSIKGTLAACALWHHDIKEMVDPFSNTGEISIEAALKVTKTSPLKFNKHLPTVIVDKDWKDAPIKGENVWCFEQQLGNLRSCKKNAKLAGVEKDITFSKVDPEWLDVKFEEGAVGNVVTLVPPITSRNADDAQIKELCHQAPFIIKKGGKLVCLCINEDTKDTLASHAKDNNLKLVEETIIYSGKLPIYVMHYGL